MSTPGHIPQHLSHLNGPEWTPTNLVDRFFSRTRDYFDRGLNRFVNGPLDRGLKFATNRPGVVVAGVVGLLVVSLSLVPAGIVPATFAPVVEGDFVTANLEMPDGTPAERTYQVAMELERAGRRVLERLVRDRPDGTPSLLSGGEANAILKDTILAQRTVANPGLTYTFGGEQQQQLESLDALYRGFVPAMLAIFALLALALGSYIKPFLVPALMAVYLRANSGRRAAMAK